MDLCDNSIYFSLKCVYVCMKMRHLKQHHEFATENKAADLVTKAARKASFFTSVTEVLLHASDGDNRPQKIILRLLVSLRSATCLFLARAATLSLHVKRVLCNSKILHSIIFRLVLD